MFINPLSSLSNSLKASFNSDFCSIDITEVLLIVMLEWCWNEKLCYSKKTMLEIISSYSEEIQNAFSAYHNIRSNVTSSSKSFEDNLLVKVRIYLICWQIYWQVRIPIDLTRFTWFTLFIQPWLTCVTWFTWFTWVVEISPNERQVSWNYLFPKVVWCDSFRVNVA